MHAPVDGVNVMVGKQRLKPEGIFYTAASGIWQSVWLEPVPAISLAQLSFTPARSLDAFTVTTKLQGNSADATPRVTAYADGNAVGEASGPAGQPLHLAIAHPRLWSPQDPFLYTFTATLAQGDQRDEVTKPTPACAPSPSGWWADATASC